MPVDAAAAAAGLGAAAGAAMASKARAGLTDLGLVSCTGRLCLTVDAADDAL